MSKHKEFEKTDPAKNDSPKSTKSTLDPSSSTFNPLESLYATNINLPVPSAPAFDNLSKFESALSGKASKLAPKRAEKQLTYEDLPPRDLTDTYQNVMKWMREITGPMQVLRDCMERKVKVKIVTRAAGSIRGYVTGYVTAFDKIWNMTIEDATEVWTRRKKKKTIPLGGAQFEIPSDPGKNRMAPVPIKITSVNTKCERCERHVVKMLLKGEHVVLVSVLA